MFCLDYGIFEFEMDELHYLTDLKKKMKQLIHDF